MCNKTKFFCCHILLTERFPRCECVGCFRLSPHGALRAYTVFPIDRASPGLFDDVLLQKLPYRRIKVATKAKRQRVILLHHLPFLPFRLFCPCSSFRLSAFSALLALFIPYSFLTCTSICGNGKLMPADGSSL